MPTYQRFEDLPVRQEAIVLAERCEDFIEAAKDRITWSKRDQIDRASLSVSNNSLEQHRRGF
jgi:hypothetical protein